MTDTMQPAPPAAPAAVLGAVTDTVADLGTTLWAARLPSELLDTVKAVQRLRSVLSAVELQVVSEVEATKAAASEGWASTRDFVTAVSGGRKGEGRRLMSLAKAVATDRNATGAALASGSISREQAQVVVEAVDRLPVDPGLRAAAEQLLLEEARTSDASDLAKAGRYVLDRLDPDGAERRDERALEREERAAHLGRFLSISEDGIGGVRVKGRGTLEDAAHLKAALFPLAAPQPASQPGACGGTPASHSPASHTPAGHTPASDTPASDTPAGHTSDAHASAARQSSAQQSSADRTGACGVADCAHDGRDPREHGTRMWDALIEAARLLTGTELLPSSHGAPARIGVIIDYDALRSGVGEGRLDTGESLSAAAVRRLACDAEILPLVLGSKSQLLDVGRTSRLVTLGLWLALIARDRHCAFPTCTRPPVACDAHHIVHWADGGVTALHNMVLLCRAHHTLIHSTPWEVRLARDDQRPEFLPPARLDSERRPLRRRPLRE